VSALPLAVGLGLVVTTSALVAAKLGLRTLTCLLLAAYVVGFAEIVAVTLLLSLAREVRAWTVLAGLAAALLVAWRAPGSLRSWPEAWHGGGSARRDVFRDPIVGVLGVAVAAGLVYSAALGLFTASNEWDAMTYHLARAAFWMQQHAVAYVPDSPVVMIDAYPPNAEVGALFTMLLSKSDRYVGLVQYTALLATALATYGISRRVGFSPRPALFGALVLLTTPVLVLQGSTALNDVVVASFLTTATYFLLGATGRELGLGGLAVALAVGTKFTAFLALPLVAVVALAGQPRRQWPKVGIAGLAGALVGSYWLVVNLLATGSLDGGASEQLEHDPDARPQAVLARATRLLAGFADSLDVGRDRLLYALSAAVLVVVLGVLWWRRGRRRWLFLAGVGAVACLPLAMPLVRGGLFRAHESLWDAVEEPGLAALAAERGSWPPSATGSYYGPIGLVLLVAGTFLVVQGVRRGVLRPLTAVLATAPFVLVVLVAIGTEFDPYRGRFLIYGVSLAAATWGVVLGRRWLAWGVVSIACTTLLLAFVHSLEKPTGLHLLDLSRTNGVWGSPRADVQAWVRPGDTAEVIRFFARERSSGRVGLLLERTDWVYPYFGPKLDREVVFVAPDADLDDFDWLVFSERRAEMPGRGWSLALRTEDGWRVYRRDAGE
jgi:4-amino-4-deoxy-L-arabinose transferase-like glycosyltransferase